MKKNIFILVLLSLLTLVDCYSLFTNIRLIVIYSIHDWNEVWQIIMSSIVSTAKSICMIILYVCAGVYLIRKTNFPNSVRLTYAQYKEKRTEKQANKKQAKIEKLKAKTENLINKLNATEKD